MNGVTSCTVRPHLLAGFLESAGDSPGPGGPATTGARTPWRASWRRVLRFAGMVLASLLLTCLCFVLTPGPRALAVTTTPTPTVTVTETATASPAPVVLDADTTDVIRYGLGLVVLFASAFVVAGWARG